MAKPKIGIFNFTGCSGCQLEILNLEDAILDIVGAIDIVNFRTAMRHKGPGPYDVAFVEGSIASKEQADELAEIRKQSGLLVAIGSCACFGGVQTIRDQTVGLEAGRKKVYGDVKMNYDYLEQKPLSDYVKVDFMLPGCPMVKEEFVEAVKALLMGRPLRYKSYPVCVECRLRENQCLIEKGEVCLGPLTMGGCSAKCTSNGAACFACRGAVEESAVAAEAELLKKKGIDPKEVLRKLKTFGANRKLEVKA